MANVAAIDGVTGPGRRTLLFSDGIQEITFRLKKQVVEVVNRDGSTGFYDLVQVQTINVSSTGNNDFTVSITSVPVEDTNERTKQDENRGRIDGGAEATRLSAAGESRGSAEGAADRATKREQGTDRTASKDRKDS